MSPKRQIMTFVTLLTGRNNVTKNIGDDFRDIFIIANSLNVRISLAALWTGRSEPPAPPIRCSASPSASVQPRCGSDTAAGLAQAAKGISLSAPAVPAAARPSAAPASAETAPRSPTGRSSRDRRPKTPPLPRPSPRHMPQAAQSSLPSPYDQHEPVHALDCSERLIGRGGRFIRHGSCDDAPWHLPYLPYHALSDRSPS